MDKQTLKLAAAATLGAAVGAAAALRYARRPRGDGDRDVEEDHAARGAETMAALTSPKRVLNA